MFRGVTETESMFRPKPNPKPKGVLVFRQNRISAKMAEIRPKAETASVSVVHYILHMPTKNVYVHFYVLKLGTNLGN